MLKYCYGFAYAAVHFKGQEVAGVKPSSFLVHAEMYVLASKYQMQGLKDLVKGKMLSWITEIKKEGVVGWIHNYATVVTHIYENTSTSDRTLRDALVSLAKLSWKPFLKKEEFRTLLSTNCEFMLDMLDSMQTLIEEAALPTRQECCRCHAKDKWTATRAVCSCGRWEDVRMVGR